MSLSVLDKVRDIKINKTIFYLLKADIFIKKSVYYKNKSETAKIK